MLEGLAHGRSAGDFRGGGRGFDSHGVAVGEDREVAEDHLFRAVDRGPGGRRGGAALRGAGSGDW